MLPEMVRLLIAVFVIPLGLDLYMPVPEDNPITVEKIELGRRLFNDRRLSRDGTIACLSCHDPDHAFSKPDAISPGVFGRRGRRNAPALINRGWGRSFFWDAGAATLEEQVLKPIEDPNEMDLPRRRGRGTRGSHRRTCRGRWPPTSARSCPATPPMTGMSTAIASPSLLKRKPD